MDNKMGPGDSRSVRLGGEASGDDEVEGHSMRAPKADEGGEDTEGHRFNVRADGDDDDTEGHRFTAPRPTAMTTTPRAIASRRPRPTAMTTKMSRATRPA